MAKTVAAEPSVKTTRLWHPFSDMASVRDAELILARGEGVWLWDERGRRYLDGTASLWYANVGHGRTEIIDAVAAQMRELETYSIFGDLANRPALDLAERLAALAPVDGARIFFTSGGGEAIETATKLARLYWQTLDRPDRMHVVSRANAYHGSHGYGTSLGGIEPNRAGFGPLAPSMTRVAHDSVDALEQALADLGPENVAAFVFEPVIGAGGVIPPAPDYIESVTELCRALGILVLCDSVICGFGRLGTWFGCERFGIEPDMITFAKGVTSGYLPLGGVVVSERVAEPFWSAPGRVPFRHGPTYAGHAACCAAGLANLDILEREGLVTRGQELEDHLMAALSALTDHPFVAEIRGGTGLLAAVELRPELLEQLPGATWRAYVRIREAGVILRPLVSSLAISPPLTIAPSELDIIADAIAAGLDGLSGDI